jgi:hypothetical protein
LVSQARSNGLGLATHGLMRGLGFVNAEQGPGGIPFGKRI